MRAARPGSARGSLGPGPSARDRPRHGAGRSECATARSAAELWSAPPPPSLAYPRARTVASEGDIRITVIAAELPLRGDTADIVTRPLGEAASVVRSLRAIIRTGTAGR